MPRSDKSLESRKLYKKYGWPEVSQTFLAENPYCFWCGRPSEATDHIQAHEGFVPLFLSPKNWQPLCNACHNLKSWAESCGIKTIQPWNPSICVLTSRIEFAFSNFHRERATNLEDWEQKFSFLSKHHGISPKEVRYNPHIDINMPTRSIEVIYRSGANKASSLGCFHIHIQQSEIQYLRNLQNEYQEKINRRLQSRAEEFATCEAGESIESAIAGIVRRS